MPIAVTVEERQVEGARQVRYGYVTFSGTYASNGEAVTPAQFGLATLDELELDGSTAGWQAVYDKANKKIKDYNGTTEATGTFTQVHRFRASGRGK